MARIVSTAALLLALLCCILQQRGQGKLVVVGDIDADGSDHVIETTRSTYQGYKAEEGFLKEIHEEKKGPIVLEATVKYRREIKNREVILLSKKQCWHPCRHSCNSQ